MTVRCGLRNRSWDNLWVAALLAMLFKVLVLPMASTLGELSLEQLLIGSYCSSGGIQPVVLDQDAAGKPVVSDAGHCCCSHGGPALLPAAFTVPQVHPRSTLVQAMPIANDRVPRERWPSINPRASPRPTA
ncbi:DUF2946 domain-containing protein [Pseudomonas capsici]|uniref:DUF2946 domain-containing protein n=1 Tax=Pseudomonas capsici TaxID=2810614 RepID=UPI0021F19FEF|nr:DUF2946 domain-containing protein [Pseudomonas capsici]MCV4289016.1 DUF2946 domain-containing protein [Pseudomonas capsici]